MHGTIVGYMRRRREQNDFVVPGAFIPHRARLESQKTAGTKRRRKLVAAGAGFVLLFTAYHYTSARLAPSNQVASLPQLVVTSTEPYFQTTLSYGPAPQLANRSLLDSLQAALAEQEASYLLVDAEAGEVRLFLKGQEVFTAPVVAVPSERSWRAAPTGWYQLTGTQARQYSALQTAYYPYAVAFARNYLIHGTPERAEGTSADAVVETGVQLRNNDAAALFALVPDELSVLVYAPHQVPAAAGYVVNGPDIGKGTYLVADVLTGQPIMQRGTTTERRSIASLTKLMTAVVAAEQLDLESEVLITQERYVQSLVPRLEGRSRTTLYNLMQLLMIESSNEAAEVIAAQMGRERFIEAMNQKADSLGLSATVFTDPSGLDAGNQSSLRDLATLTSYVFEQHRFIFTLSVEEEVVRTERPDDFVNLQNFNIVPELTDLIGGKIGETMAAGQTSVTVHSVAVAGESRPIVVVLLGSDSRDADVTTIHQYFIDRF